MKFARQLSAENLAEHYKPLETVASTQVCVVSQPENSSSFDCSYQLQEAETVASPQVTVVRQPEIFGCLDRTSAVSQQYRYLTSEREIVGIAQVQSDLNKLSAEAAVEHSSSLLKDCEDSDIGYALCQKRGSQTELRRCAGCKSFSYCSKDCQRSDWPSHKRLCKSIQLLVVVFVNFSIVYSPCNILYSVHWCW